MTGVQIHAPKPLQHGKKAGPTAHLQWSRHVASLARPASDLPRLHPVYLPQQLLIPSLDRQPLIHRGPRQGSGWPSAWANAVEQHIVAPACNTTCQQQNCELPVKLVNIKLRSNGSTLPEAWHLGQALLSIRKRT